MPEDAARDGAPYAENVMNGDRFDELKGCLEGRFQEIDARLTELPTRAEMDARFDEVVTRAEMDAGFKEVSATFGELREYVDERASRIEQRTEVLIECVRSDIRLLAEGQTAVVSDIQELKAGQRRTDERLGRLEVGQQALLEVTRRIETRLEQA